MNSILREKKLILISLILVLFFIANIIVIYKFDKVDRTVLISEPYTVKKGTLKETLITEGEIEPSNTFKVYYEEPKGTLDEILVDEGQEVRIGTPLLNYINENDNSGVTELEEVNKRLSVKKDKLNEDIAVLQSEIDQYTSLQTDEVEGNANLDNTRILNHEIKNIEYEIKMIELRIEENETSIDMVSKRDEPTIIESKIEGIVVQRDEFSRTSEVPLLTIMSRSPLLVDVLVGEKDTQRIKINQKVIIKPKHLNSETVSGKVFRISDIPYGVEEKKDNSLYKVTVQIDDAEETSEAASDNSLRFGSHVNASITLKELKDVLILPKKTLSGNKVVLLEKGKLVTKLIKRDLSVNNEVAVTKGLKENQLILSKADSHIEGDTSYIKFLSFNNLTKDAYKRFSIEERLWLVARGMIQ